MLTMEDGRRTSILRPRRRPDLTGGLFDAVALAAVLVLVALGALNLYAVAGWSRAAHQLAVVAGGLVVLVALRRSRVQRLALLGWLCYGVSVLLLAAVLVVGLEAYSARRWLDTGWFTVQPSELAKLGLLLVLAHTLASDRPAWRRFVTAAGLAAVPIGLTVVQPDLSTAILLAGLTLAMLVLGRIPARFLVTSVVTAAAAAPLVVPLLRAYQLERLQAFFSGWVVADGPSAYTLRQAHIALASGGLTGRFGEPFADLLAQYLPANQTDFALASLVEQWGLAAGAAALAAALVLIWRVALASRVPRSRPGRLAGGGLAVLLGMQVVVSVGANLGALPITGIPYPLLSYGGSAATVYLAALGIVLGARRDGVRRRLWAPPRRTNPGPPWVRRTALGVTGVLAALSSYGWHLQAAHGESLRRAGETQMTRCLPIPAPRGIITDRHGTPLAVNVTDHEVAAVPALLLRGAEAVTRLAVLMGRPATGLHHILAAGERFVPLGVVPAETGGRIAAEGLAGVVVFPSPRRLYPHGGLLGPLLGFAGVATPRDHQRWPGLRLGETVGRSGIEQQYDPVLRGVPGAQCLYVDPRGRPVAMGSRRDPLPGMNLRLSIDLGLQQELTAALVDALAADPSRRDLAGAVAMDPRTGQVLAMASVPAYDNNLYGPPVDGAALRRAEAAPGHPLIEHTTQVAGPPGSTFKVVVAAANAAAPVVAPDQRVPTGGRFAYGGHSFRNWRTFGAQNLVEAIAWSNNVYFYKLAVALGPERIHEAGTALGVGQRTGIDLPGETPAFFGHPGSVEGAGGRWYPGSTVILGIGQGYVTVTPLQAARWTGAIATGQVVTPRLGLAFDPGDGHLTPLPVPPPVPLEFASSLGPVREGMRRAVVGGTAGLLRTLPVPALAKTGTAQDPSSPTGAPSSWFIAAAPADDPVIAVASFVRGGGGGSRTSGPVALRAMRYFFDHREEIGGSAHRGRGLVRGLM